MRHFLLLAAACCALAAEEPLGPGRHLDLKIPGKREAWSWNAYIPKRYDESGKTLLPALFLSAPKGNPGLGGLEEWSESRGIIIIGINGTANGQTFDTIHLIQDATYAEVNARIRIHPFLRFATGGSGGGHMSYHLAIRHAAEFAGVFQQISADGPPLPKHIAVGYFLQRNDPDVPFDSVMPRVEATRSNGNQVRLEIGTGGHEGAGDAIRMAMLDWMVTAAQLSHPRLTPADRAAFLDGMKARIAGEPADDAEAARRISLCAGLLAFPALARDPAGAPFAKTWQQLSLAAANRIADPWKQHVALLAMAESDAIAAVDAAGRKEVQTKLMELRKTQPVKDEWAALSAYREIQAAERKAGTNKARLGEACRQYQELAQHLPATEFGAAAKADAARLSGTPAGK